MFGIYHLSSIYQIDEQIISNDQSNQNEQNSSFYGLIISNIIFAMFLFSYIRVCCHTPGHVSKFWLDKVNEDLTKVAKEEQQNINELKNQIQGNIVKFIEKQSISERHYSSFVKNSKSLIKGQCESDTQFKSTNPQHTSFQLSSPEILADLGNESNEDDQVIEAKQSKKSNSSNDSYSQVQQYSDDESCIVNNRLNFDEELVNELTMMSIVRKYKQHKRFCNKCKFFKPDRTHHCSKCNNCILKMDHHCMWVNNCIGILNHKLFIVMLIYASILLIYSTLTYLECFLDALNTENINKELLGLIIYEWVFLFVSCISVTGFLMFHVQLISQNQTTLEFTEKNDISIKGSIYNLGCKENLYQVFGKQLWTMFLPVEAKWHQSIDEVGTSFELNQ